MLVIYGPTATGKTALAIRLARKFNGELISADSRQVYKSLDIGTGKIQPSSKFEKHDGFWIVDGVKVHGFDLTDPGKDFSAADFVKFAHTTIIQITEVGKLPIIVGGTGFYIKALLDGLASAGVPQDPRLRSQLEKLSATTLFQKLAKINPRRASSMNESDRANPRRLIRAIEVAISNQKSKIKNQNNGSSQQALTLSDDKTKNLKFEIGDCLLIGLNATNDYLYDRADDWLNTRIKNGMIEEVKHLIDNKISTSWLDSLGLEYRWITRYLKANVSKDLATERLKGDIHNFIRRQKTYFRQFEKNNIKLVDILQKGYEIKLEKTVNEWLKKH